MTFQKKVSLGLSKGWEGDFASTNVRVSLLGDPQAEEITVVNAQIKATSSDVVDGDSTVEIKGNFTLRGAYYQAGEGGVRVGSFVWVDKETNTLVNQSQKGTNSSDGSEVILAPDGFIGRELTGVPASFLEGSSLQIPAGFMVTAYAKGEFLVRVPDDDATVTVERGNFVKVNNEGKVTISKDGIETTYKYVANAKAGELVAISAWI